MHRVPFGVHDLAQDAGALGGDVDVDLLGFELDQRVAGLNTIAGLLQPRADRRLDHRLPQDGHPHFNRHGPPLLAGPPR
jgi:hypothetical protein